MSDSILWRPFGSYLADANLNRFLKTHAIPSYGELVARSNDDIEWFWKAALEDLGVEWYKPYVRLLDSSRGFAWCRWFAEGEINIAHNCVDRHATASPAQYAILWEGDSGELRQITYAQLNEESGRLAQALSLIGVGQGDTVGFYMPMVPELVSAFFAVLKLGAVAVPVFSAFGPEALAVRLKDARAKVLFTADGCFRRGHAVDIKAAADKALDSVPAVQKVVVVRRTGARIPWFPGRDLWFDEFLDSSTAAAGTVHLPAEALSMIVFTSGTTGRPKGTVHTHGGVLAQVAKELAYNFDLKAGERFFWLTDIGWMMGPWELIGVTFHGGACLIFEGAPNWPAPDRLWRIVERHRLTHLGLSPTAVRLLAREGEAWVRDHDLSSLRILGSTGEPWDPDSYLWFFRNAGGGRCPIINISGGTEVMGSLLACAPVAPLKACSFHGPGLGMDADIVGEDGRTLREAVGHLVVRKPAPSMTRGFLNDPERYLRTYFARWPDLWSHGDWGLVDHDGFWYIRGRADDTIKIAGKRTGPAEIEAVLIGHAAVSEAAAIGVPHALKGEVAVCFVVVKPGVQGNEELAHELRALIADSLGKPLRPDRVLFVAALPKTRSAKIVRGAIRRRYLGLDPGDTSSIENLDALASIPVAECPPAGNEGLTRV